MYKPESWAVRYTADGNRDEWRKYPTLQAANLGIQGMQHFSGMEGVEEPNFYTRYRSAPLTVEIWRWWAPTGGYPMWVLTETRVYRTNDAGKREVFSA